MARPGWILPLFALLLVLGSCSMSKPAPPPAAEAPAAEAPPSPPPPPPPPQGNAGGGGGAPDTPGQKKRRPEFAIPEFPWPPPAASARETVPGDLLATGRRLGRLGDVDAVLSAALDRAGYAEKSYWAVPRGFALATRLEQIDATGKPKPPPARWSAEMPRLAGEFSLGAYLRALFTADPGYYRIVVFIVTDTLFSESDRSVSPEEARSWVAKGLNALPESIASQPYGPAVISTALIYEFEREAGSEPQALVPSPVDAHAHLVGSGLWSALGGR
jgi:hypothetical protein